VDALIKSVLWSLLSLVVLVFLAMALPFLVGNWVELSFAVVSTGECGVQLVMGEVMLSLMRMPAEVLVSSSAVAVLQSSSATLVGTLLSLFLLRGWFDLSCVAGVADWWVCLGVVTMSWTWTSASLLLVLLSSFSVVVL